MRDVTCICGTEFQTNHSHKFYCSLGCQLKNSYQVSWNNSKLDYKVRCRRLVQMARNRAKTNNLFFNITPEYLINIWEEQNGCCAISGRQFELERPNEYETVKANAPSLDRIDSSRGYEEGNVRLVCYQVNAALNEYGEESLISLCKDILEFNLGVIQ